MPPLLDDLAVLARRHTTDTGPPRVLSDRTDGLVLRLGDVVVKAHPVGTDGPALTARLRVAAGPALRSVVLAPRCGPLPVRDRLATVWPAGDPVDPADPDRAPWESGARLLAALHAVPVDRPAVHAVPAAGGPARVVRAMTRLAAVRGAAADTVRRAYRALPALSDGAVPATARTLVHGDWHLGQLVRTDDWYLIDLDELGTGDPAWDLARPAALFAAGLLDPVTWQRFLGAYRSAGGAAVPATGDVWGRLDVPAQALVVQCAALVVVSADRAGRALADADLALLDACTRIAAPRRLSPTIYRGGSRRADGRTPDGED